MRRFPVLAIVAAAAFALAGCTGGDGQGGSAIPLGGAETVGDAAAIMAHRPTDTQTTATAIDAVGALGSRIAALSRTAGDDDAGHATGTCRDGRRFFAPDRRGDARSTETRDYFDSGCTQLARDTLRLYTLRGAAGEVVERAISLYERGRSSPVAVRRETSFVSNARFGRWGFPLARDGFAQTTASALWVGNRRQSTEGSGIVLLPGRGVTTGYCQDSAGYSTAGFPSLDATFGWEGGTLDSQISATRTTEGDGAITLASIEQGQTFVGPIGSLATVAQRHAGSCPAASAAYRLSGGEPAGVFIAPIRATYRDGRLRRLSVSGASFSGGYRLNAVTTTAGLETPRVTGTLSGRGFRVAEFETDAFGNGTLTIASTGAQYRLIDWTIVR
jgi:hypothetical protein